MFSVKSVQSSERKMLLLSGCQTQQTRPGWRVSPQHLARLIKCLDLHVYVCMKPCLPHLAVLPVSEENLRHFLPSRWRTAMYANNCHVSIYFRSRWSDLWWCTKKELWINYRCVHLVFIVWCISYDVFKAQFVFTFKLTAESSCCDCTPHCTFCICFILHVVFKIYSN